MVINYVRFASTLLMVLSSFLVNISQVIANSSQDFNAFHYSADRSDFEEGPVLYQAYYPDDKKLEQEKPLRPSYAHTQQLYEYSLSMPLRKYVYNSFGNGNRHSIESQEMYQKPNSETAFNSLIDTIGDKPKNSIDQRLLISKFHNRGHLIAKTYIEYWELVGDLIYKRAYNKIIPQLLAPHTNAHDQSIRTASLKENILQPRPQLINYKSDPQLKHLKQISKSNLPAQSHDDNTVDNDNDISNLSWHRRVKSIKVGTESNHKIRHHHGEWERKFF